MAEPNPPAAAVSAAGSPTAVGDAARIEITGLTKRFLTAKGEPFTAIRDVTLHD